MFQTNEMIIQSPDGARKAEIIGTRLAVDASIAPAINPATNVNLDLLGRTRVGNPQTMFECSFRYDKQSTHFTEKVATGGTVTHNANEAQVYLNTTTSSGSSATFQGKRTPYHPGKANQCLISGGFQQGFAGLQQRLGCFDDNNGLFFQNKDNAMSVVIRTKTTGSVVDSTIDQASWNIDKLDGSGASGKTVDWTKNQLFFIEYLWLGIGPVRFGVYIDGRPYYCHQQEHGNSLVGPYTQTGSLPIRAEITNTSAQAAVRAIRLVCCTMISEGDWGPDGTLKSVNNGLVTKLCSTVLTPVISLRLKSANLEAILKMVRAHIFSRSADDILWALVFNPTLTGAVWTDAGGFAEFDVTAITMSGGNTIHSGYFRGAAGTESDITIDIFNHLHGFLCGDVNGNSEIMTLAARAFTGTADITGSLTYKELT